MFSFYKINKNTNCNSRELSHVNAATLLAKIASIDMLGDAGSWNRQRS